ncbi:MAG: hypothetical protein JF611_06285 [Betaproteobacteria bacterium]|nr:hypothetical protein [Betaproteobacteria bacterium]
MPAGTAPRIVAALFTGGVACASAAPPNEIKVFTDELASYRQHTLETHVNKGNASAPLQIMPEYSYGIHPNWELSLQLPFAFTTEHAKAEGYRVELEYIAPHNEEAGLYWGINVEVARINRIDEQSYWNLELIPIVGYRRARWHVVANPALEKPSSGSAVMWSPSAKVAYRAFGRNYFGAEYYVEAGPLRHRLPSGEQSRTVYLAWDGKAGRSDVNVGIGRGLTDASERWVIKSIIEITF